MPLRTKLFGFVEDFSREIAAATSVFSKVIAESREGADRLEASGGWVGPELTAAGRPRARGIV